MKKFFVIPALFACSPFLSAEISIVHDAGQKVFQVVSDSVTPYNAHVGVYDYPVPIAALPNAGTDAWVVDLGPSPSGLGSHWFAQVSAINTGFILLLPGAHFEFSDSAVNPTLLDALMNPIGMFSSTLTPVVMASAGGPYRVEVGEILHLDASDSYFMPGWGWHVADAYGFDALDSIHWSIDGQSVGQDISYETLVNELGLTAGVYDVELVVIKDDVYGPYDPATDIASTTLEIAAEPCNYVVAGDLDGNCVVDLADFGVMVINWLIDCTAEPVDPACVLVP